MFVQVIQAQTKDAAAVKALIERWRSELSPGATGWVGSTGGVTDDGTLIALACFDSASSAQANSERPEQGAWWAEVEALLEGEATFQNCTDVHLLGGGPSERAGFVQVMQGRITDRDALTGAWSDLEKLLATERPEILGTMLAFHDSGDGFTEAAYFTTEAEARAGESKEPSEEAKRMWERERELYADMRYFDLKDPWLAAG